MELCCLKNREHHVVSMTSPSFLHLALVALLAVGLAGPEAIATAAKADTR
jgi:hypothetical protein